MESKCWRWKSDAKLCSFTAFWILSWTLFHSVSSSAIRDPIDIDGIIDLDHEYLTYDSIPDDDDDVTNTAQYYFRSDKHGGHPLNRKPQIDLNAPLCFLENGELVCEYGRNDKNSQNAKDNEFVDAAAIANENGTLKMSGIVTTEDRPIELKPINLRGQDKSHVIRKRWTANVVHRRTFKQTPRFRSRSQYESYETRLPEEPDVSEYCVDIICVVDYSIFKKFNEKLKSTTATLEKIRYYYAHVIHGINMRYASISQKGLKLKIRLAGYFVAKDPKDLPFISTWEMSPSPKFRVNGRATLESLDSYLKKLQRKDKRLKLQTLPDFNHAMLFLEYTATNLGGSILGTSFVNGICSESRSTSLVVDHGAYTSAGIGTHELGHNLGVQDHDGEGSARSAMCNASLNYIMAPASYLIDETNLRYSFTFSKCSIKQIHENLERLSRSALHCLSCKAREHNALPDTSQYLKTLPGTKDTVHDQCRELYGEGSFMCPPKSPQEMCYRMYCYDPKRSACAIISEQMAVPGTPCGSYKVCKMGSCEFDRRGIDVPDDCPYPDIPSNGAHCEDATPFMCQNERFRKKCCQSCNKDFTEEEACKDTHMIINKMNCAQLVQTMLGKFACQTDEKVQNYCCRSCKNIQDAPNPPGTRFIVTQSGTHNSPNSVIQSNILNRNPSASNFISNPIVRTNSRHVTNAINRTPRWRTLRAPSRVVSRSQRLVSRSAVPSSSVVWNNVQSDPVPVSTGECKDSTWITINKMTCSELITKEGTRMCAVPQVKNICCYTCSNYLK